MTTKVERHLALMRLIPVQPRKASTEELQSKLSVDGIDTHIRNVQRDLNDLSRKHALTVEKEGKTNYWYKTKADKYFDANFSPSSALAMNMMKQHAFHLLPQSVYQNLESFFLKAEEKLKSTKNNPLNNWPSKVVSVPAGYELTRPSIKEGVINNIEQALLHEHCLEMDYSPKPPREKSTYRLTPLGLVVKGNVFYLVATKLGTNDFRHFALHRINNVQKIECKAITPEGFDLTHYINSGSLSFPIIESVELVVKVDSVLGYHLQKMMLSEDQRVTYDNDDPHHFTITATVNYTEELLWWLMSIANISEVVAPQRIRGDLLKNLDQALNRYK
ncbi:WYL domain-containing protein [Shewanella sp. PP-Sp27a-2]